VREVTYEEVGEMAYVTQWTTTTTRGKRAEAPKDRPGNYVGPLPVEATGEPPAPEGVDWEPFAAGVLVVVGAGRDTYAVAWTRWRLALVQREVTQ